MSPQLRWFRFSICLFLTVYLNLVLTNVVSLRQAWFVDVWRNGTAAEPLYDSLFLDWIQGYKIPIPIIGTLRDMVDFCTYSWVGATLLVWVLCSRKPIILAKGLMAQMVFIPAFSVAQLLTIVPDATPNCLEVYHIPRGDDMSWVFWKYPHRACGNMMWSSDITQLLIFTGLAVQMVHRDKRKLRYIVWFIGECWTLMTMIFVFSSRYQYSVDVVTTMVIVKLAMSNPTVERWATYLFIRNGHHFERVLLQELPKHVTL